MQLTSADIRAAEREMCRRSFAYFVRRGWHVVEPSTKLKWGWALDGICQHLEAVTNGDIQNLLATVPPGSMKALDVATPVPTLDGWVNHGDLQPGQYVFGEDGTLKRVIATTQHVSEMGYKITFDDKTSIVAGAAHEWKVSREIGDTRKRETKILETRELLHGDRPDRIPLPSGPVYRPPQNLTIDPYILGAWLGDGGSDVGSLYVAEIDIDHFGPLGEPKLINPASERGQAFYRVRIPGLQIALRVSGLLKNKHVPSAYEMGSLEQRIAFVQGLFDTDGHCEKGGRAVFTNKNRQICDALVRILTSLGLKPYLKEKISVFNGKKYGPHWQVFCRPNGQFSFFRLKRKAERQKPVRQDRYRNRYIKSIEPIGTRKVNCIQVEGGLYLAGEHHILTHNSLLVGVFWPAWEWGPRNLPHMRYVGTAHEQELAIRDSRRCRDLIKSEWYQERWPVTLKTDLDGKREFGNDKQGMRSARAFTSMTGVRGDRVILDDPISAHNANSPAKLYDAEVAFLETLPTRINDADESSIVVIMQRLHQKDVAGIILAKGLNYVHLNIPMEFEPDRRCTTSIGWTDPRTEADELMFPERFNRKAVDELKRTLGSYGCTPKESPVLMADLSMKPISEVRLGDAVIGWGAPDTLNGKQYSRQHLKRAVVKNVFRYPNAPVMKMTLETGEVVRCTADHKWFRKHRSDYGGNYYAPAKVGTKLARVCDPKLPELSADEQRDAGWLGGFFDGEGTCTAVDRKGLNGTASRIVFYQGYGRNAPICEKLERILGRFKFDYKVTFDERKDPTAGVNFEYRNYTLQGQKLPLHQKFLHVAQPVKWRDRIAEGALGAKWIKGREKVISIEFDTVEDVYALETTTGNYVVWGLASSNSAGQLQQRPSPRGGGIIKSDWWQYWTVAPKILWRMIYADTALEAGEEHDYSVFQCWGMGDDGRIYLLDQKRGKWEAPDLKREARKFWNKHKAAKDVGALRQMRVEKKASGHGLIQGLKRSEASEPAIPVAGIKRSTDKVSRANNVSPQIEAGNVVLPQEASWIDDYVDEFNNFPAGANDDQCDPTFDAIDEMLGKVVRTPPPVGAPQGSLGPSVIGG